LYYVTRGGHYIYLFLYLFIYYIIVILDEQESN